MTDGFWGIVTGGKKKMIASYSDSYPRNLGKNVIFAIQNGLDVLKNAFDKIIFVKDVNKLDRSERQYILFTPDELITEKPKEKYFSENAENYWGEYGYLINIDENVLTLFKNEKEMGSLSFDALNYFDVVKLFDEELD